MDVCPNATRAFNQQGQVIAMACDKWACPVCGPLQAWRWARRIRFGIALSDEREAYFWTLTLPAWVDTAEKGYEILPARWDNLRKHIQRAMGRWDYAAFVEEHPQRDFIPHMHIISLKASPERLKDLACHAGFGYMATEDKISGSHAAFYVSKYCSKQGRAMPKGFRRVRTSQGWPRLPEPEYDIPVLPLRKREALPDYFNRVSLTSGVAPSVLATRWLDKPSTIH